MALCVYVNALPQTPPAPAQPQSPVLKSEVRVVLVDVVVTQKKDQPVGGLRREDFQILEDGKPQTISYFEEHSVAPSLPPAKTPALPPNTFSNAQSAAQPDAVNVLLLDWLNTQPQDRPFAQKQIADYIRRMPAGTSMATFVLGSHLQMVEGFNSSPTALLAMLEKQKNGAARQSSSLLASNAQNIAETQMVDAMRMMQTAPAAIEAVEQENASSNSALTTKRIGITLQAMQELARYLSGLPGRKNVIWFSSAFPISLFPRQGDPQQFGQELKRTADLLTEGRVSIYPVSAAGLTQGLTVQTQIQNQQQNAQQGTGELGVGMEANQMSMDALAKDTGGKAFYNTNGIAEALAHAVDNGSHYYTLTYSPFNNVMDGKFRKIEVKIAHRGYKVAHRQGYYASDSKADPAEAHSSGDALARMVRFGMPDVAQLPYSVRLSAVPLDGASSVNETSGAKNLATRFTVDFNIPLAGLSVESSPDGAYRDLVTILVTAYDFKGKLLNATERKYPITMDLGEYARARQEGLQLLGEIDVPRGEFVLRTGVSEVNSSNIGTLAIPLSESAIQSALAPPPDSHESAATSPASPPSPAPAETSSAPPASSSSAPAAPAASAPLPVIGPPCQLEYVLPRVARHIKEFVENMNEFTATEELVRERTDLAGKHAAHTRTRSDYVVTIQNLGAGNYTVSEFRNNTRGVHLEGGLSASGAPALALIFHPSHLEEFDMTCGNLVSLGGHSAWEVHFRQRKDRAAQITTFLDGHTQFSILLAGTAWIDSTSNQLIRIETDLLQPIPEAKLDSLHQSVEYAGVNFAARNSALWLPQSAEVTARFHGQRYRDQHTFSDFKLFAVDTGQKISAPKEVPPPADERPAEDPRHAPAAPPQSPGAAPNQPPTDHPHH